MLSRISASTSRKRRKRNTGEIELLVRFRTQTVSGRISKLTDARGWRWAYGRTGETIDQRLFDRDSVEWISLPDTRLETRADWARAKREPVATIFYIPGGLPPERVPATFVGHLVSRGREADAREAWDRVESRIRVWTGSTRYTRFGAWRKQTAVNAVADYVDRLELDGKGPDAFAYSPLLQTAYTGDTDPRFPLGTSATYSGDTVAVQETSFYTGTVELRVRWHDAWQGAEAGRLWAAISGLRNDLGDWLAYAEAGGTRRRFVDTMRIANVAILVDSGKVRFADDSSSQATIRFADRATATPEAASIEGKFVGNSKDGPLAAIGLWTVESGARLGSGGRMRGAFGAEFAP